MFRQIAHYSSILLVGAAVRYTIAQEKLSAPQTTQPAVRAVDVESDSARRRYEVVRNPEFVMASPVGWRDEMIVMRGQTKLYRQGGFEAEAPIDETGAPLQIGFSVECFPISEMTARAHADRLAQQSAQSPVLKPVGSPKIREIHLSDGTEAALLTVDFIKEESRRSLQIKLIAKDKSGRAWIVSGFGVGGMNSKMPTPDSDLGKWLTGYVRSFCFDQAKFDPAIVPGRFGGPGYGADAATTKP